MEYRTCLWNKELYVKHGDLQRPHAEGSARRSVERSSTPIASKKKAPEG
jgi:hypothetical protein